jgi:hypothetical protein
MEQNKDGFMGFMIHWISGMIIKPAQIENIELYSSNFHDIIRKIDFPGFHLFFSKNKSQNIGND